jgi:hypothetical protein
VCLEITGKFSTGVDLEGAFCLYTMPFCCFYRAIRADETRWQSEIRKFNNTSSGTLLRDAVIISVIFSRNKIDLFTCVGHNVYFMCAV